MMVEARKMNDQFEGGVARDPSQPGIRSEGVIVYRVQTPALLGNRQNNRLPLFLLTPAAIHRFRGTDRHIRTLYWSTGAVGRDLTALAGAPAAAGTSAAGYNPATNTSHVFYRAGDGSLHELWRNLGSGTVAHVNLTTAYEAPSAVDRPTSYVSARAPNQHVAYRAANGHFYELLW